MSASFLSSFIIFVVAGVVAFADLYGGMAYFQTVLTVGGEELEGQLFLTASWLTTIGDWRIEFMLFGAILVNALYFYYFAAMCEMEEKFVTRLKDAPKAEWRIRVFNSLLFLSIWFWLQLSSIWFTIYLVVLYGSFIWWNKVARQYIEVQDKEDAATSMRKVLGTTDWRGLIISIALGANLIWIEKSGGANDPMQLVFIGIILAVLVWNVFDAIQHGIDDNQFRPWDKKYRQKDTVR